MHAQLFSGAGSGGARARVAGGGFAAVVPHLYQSTPTRAPAGQTAFALVGLCSSVCWTFIVGWRCGCGCGCAHTCCLRIP